jgi:hypothetical protein
VELLLDQLDTSAAKPSQAPRSSNEQLNQFSIGAPLSMSAPLTTSSSIDHDNLAAQRAAAEAIEVGRATLSQTVQQGEQLRGAERVADETQYAVDRAGRILRGMTWSGWVANLVTSDVTRPTSATDSSSSTTTPSSWLPSFSSSTTTSSAAHPSCRTHREPPLVYETVPHPCADAAQAVQNYHANLLIYLQCETPEQKETSRLICDDMHRVAEAKVQALLRCSASNDCGTSEIAAFYPALAQDLQLLRRRQAHGSPNTTELKNDGITPKQSSQAAPATPSLSTESNRRTNASLSAKPPSGLVQAQDEHLSVLSQNLDELGSLASALNESILHQNGTMDRLHDKTDSILEQSQRVTRRAERMTHRVSGGWFMPSSLSRKRPVFVCRVVIRHASNQALLLGRVQGDVYLLSSAAGRGGGGTAPISASSSAVTFLLYRRGMFVGLKHEATNTWLGQNVLGSLACTATAMGTRDEWQVDEGSLQMVEDGSNVESIDDRWSSFTSTLLCASAGWGSGGYLYVRPRDQAVLIGGSTVEEKRRAAHWTFEKLPPVEHSTRVG